MSEFRLTWTRIFAGAGQRHHFAHVEMDPEVMVNSESGVAEMSALGLNKFVTTETTYFGCNIVWGCYEKLNKALGMLFHLNVHVCVRSDV